GFLVRLREAVAGGLHARWPVVGEVEQASVTGAGGGLEVTVASVTGTGLAMRSRAIEIEAENVAVRDATMRGGAFSLASVSVGKLSLELDLGALLAGSVAAEGAGDASSGAPSRASSRASGAGAADGARQRE